MAAFRRVVTGHRPDGHSVIASDQTVTGARVPGMATVELTTLWGADAPLHYPDDGRRPSFETWFAPVGGFRFIEFVLEPDPRAAPAAAAVPHAIDQPAEVERLFPGLMSTMDPERPGMHRSRTVDLL